MVDVNTFTGHWVLLTENNKINYSQHSWAPLILVQVSINSCFWATQPEAYED